MSPTNLDNSGLQTLRPGAWRGELYLNIPLKPGIPRETALNSVKMPRFRLMYRVDEYVSLQNAFNPAARH